MEIHLVGAEWGVNQSFFASLAQSITFSCWFPIWYAFASLSRIFATISFDTVLSPHEYCL